MSKRTDFGRLAGASGGPSARRRAARTALFTAASPDDADANDVPIGDAENDGVPLGSESAAAVDAGSPLPPRSPEPSRSPVPPRSAGRSYSSAAVPPRSAGRSYSSTAEPAPRAGEWFVLSCSRCERSTRLGLLGLVRASVPSLHLPFVKPTDPSFMRCPRCRSHQWVTLTLKL